MAAETEAGGTPAATHESVGHEGKSPLPQLDFSTYAPQLFWLGLSFVLLYVLMARIALPRIATVIEERRDKIADDLDKAQLLKTQADEALAAYEQALAQARSRAIAIEGEMREKLKAETDALRADVEARLSREATEAEARIRRTKEAALANLKAVASDATGLVVQRLINVVPDPGDVQRAVEGEMAGR